MSSDPAHPPTRGSLFAGVDMAVFTASFAQRLRDAGADVAFHSTERCAASLATVDPPRMTELYWLLRLCFVHDIRELGRFDAVFDAVFQTESSLLRSKNRDHAQTTPPTSEDDELLPLRRATSSLVETSSAVPWATLPSITEDAAADEDHGAASAIPELRPSADDAELDRPFDAFDQAELDRIGALLEEQIDSWPHRRSRRRRETRSGGPLALRRSLRSAMRTGGDVATLWYTAPRQRPRPVVVLVDVSGSMESSARAYLHLTRPLAVTHHAEIFAFSTRLTRITPSVRLRSPADAIDHVSDSVGDRFSGTRLASSLTSLLRHRTWSTMIRGAVVLICSDGWDSDPAEDMERAMKRLSRLAHRVVWVNPRAAATDFEPRTAGMAAAMPYCDQFLPGNTARSMESVIAVLTAA